MSARHRNTMRRVQRERLRLWYVYDCEAVYEEEANGQLIVASCASQAAAIWRRHHGLAAVDLGEEQLAVKPAVWERADEPEPVHPKRPGVWWPKGEAFRGYGIHLVEDDTCGECGEYVATVDDDGLCEGCADPAQSDLGLDPRRLP